RRADGSPLLKVLDFGVSKAQFANDQQLTNTQAVMGTPTYMSPEQLRSSKYVDVRSDIWSMGVTLYHLLAGRPPFTGVNLSAMCLAIATEAPRPLTAPLPTGLDDVVMRCIAKEPAQRYQDVAELAAALAPYASAPQRAALTVERCRRILAKADPVAGVAVYNSAGMDALLAEDDDGTTAMIDGTTAVLDREDISDLAEPDRPDEPNEPDAQAQHAPPARWATVLAIALIAAVSLAVLLILYMVGGGESEPAAEQEPAAAKQPGSGALPSVDDGVDAADAANAADEIDERYSLTPSAEERSGKHNGQPVSETATDTNQPAVPAPVRPEQPGAEVDTGTARPAPRTGRERRSGRDARKRRSESAAPRPADNATPAASSEGTPDDTGDGLKLDSRH
ncbi:MAG: protein kinase, partial [Myxococcota bacterium]